MTIRSSTSRNTTARNCPTGWNIGWRNVRWRLPANRRRSSTCPAVRAASGRCSLPTHSANCSPPTTVKPCWTSPPRFATPPWRRFRLLQCSAFAITLPDNSVDCVFSIRLMHHIGESTNRVALLKEFRRVTRDTVVLSLWVDGNYKAWRRRKLEEKRRQGGEKSDNRFIVPSAQFEQECRDAGLVIVGHVDFLPRVFMWRTYVLRKKSV
jgi:hypothetical protein